jgi:hypothetical protein
MASHDHNRDRDKPAAAELLRQTLASAAAEAGLRGEECPDPDILAAYADRALDADETAHYELHFSQCAHCRAQLALMSRAAASAATLPGNSRARRFHWVWPWTWFVLTPVTAALLFAAVFIVRRPATKTTAETPLVAMQESNQPPVATGIPEYAPAPLVPASPEPEVRRSASAKTTIPPSPSRGHSQPGSMQRSASDFTDDVQSGSGQVIGGPATQEKELSGNSASSLPLPSRNYPAADKFANREPRKPASSAQTTDAAATRSKTETATTDSGAAVEPLSAPVAPPLASNVAAGAVSAGNATGQPSASMAKKAPAFTASTSTNLVANETVSVESLADRDARTIVRSPDPQILWRISSGRFVERSNDAGATWRSQWTSVNAHVVAGSAPSVDTCWLVGRGGFVLLTTDGRKWRAIEPPANADFVAVEASSADAATVTSTDGRTFDTVDGGKHWTPAP